MDIAELQARILAFRDDRDWKQFHNPKDLAEAIAIESGELLEHFLWRSQEESFTIAQGNSDVQDEFADILNNLLMFADACHIDIEQAVLTKLEKNKQKYPLDQAKGKAEKRTHYIAYKKA